jgi:hypothetical protein
LLSECDIERLTARVRLPGTKKPTFFHPRITFLFLPPPPKKSLAHVTYVVIVNVTRAQHGAVVHVTTTL